jgi:6,7-dimethyl-8-ribityllumazine synthase
MRADTNESLLNAAGLRVTIAVSRYHRAITDALCDGAKRAFLEAGGLDRDLLVVEAPGAFELPVICQAIADVGYVDAIVALGCVIAGETPHDQYIGHAVSHGLTQVALRAGIPVAFGVLTCRNMEQAAARAGGEKGNKGAEAMHAAIASAATIRSLRARSQRGQWNAANQESENPIEPHQSIEIVGSTRTGNLNRDIRRCALQLLYQFDAGNADAPDSARLALADAPYQEADKQRATELAASAWAQRAAADAAVALLTPDWPTHRQPVVDRSILRLAHYEMSSGLTPPKVAINEAVELAKEFSTERSPMFINGVLDRLYKARRDSSNREDAPAPSRATI